MVLRWVLTLIIVAVAALPAAAEFYKYRDKSGAIRFTDNIAEVPPAQRKKLKTYQGAAAPAPEARTEEVARQASPDAGATAAGGTDSAEKQAADEMVAELRQRNQALIEEYEALQKEREALEQPAGRRVSEAEQKKYDSSVAALNAKIQDYQQRRQAYESDVAAHNEKMKQRLRPGPDQAQAQ